MAEFRDIESEQDIYQANRANLVNNIHDVRIVISVLLNKK